MILNAVKNSAAEDGHRKYSFKFMAPLLWCLKCLIYAMFSAVQACLALCAECFIGCIEGMVSC